MNLIDPTGMWSFVPSYDQGPMPNPGANNPFWWVAERIYKKWIENEYSKSEIEWNSSLLNDEENTKSSDISEEIKEGDTPEPGDPDFIGPVEEEGLLATDWIQINIGLSIKGPGGEASFIIMPDGKLYLAIYLTAGISTPIMIEYKQVSFAQNDEAPDGLPTPSEDEQINSFLNQPQWGINAGAGLNFDVTLGTPNNVFRKEPSSYGFGLMYGASLNVYGTSYIPIFYLGQFDFLRKK